MCTLKAIPHSSKAILSVVPWGRTHAQLVGEKTGYPCAQTSKSRASGCDNGDGDGDDGGDDGDGDDYGIDDGRGGNGNGVDVPW